MQNYFIITSNLFLLIQQERSFVLCRERAKCLIYTYIFPFLVGINHSPFGDAVTIRVLYRRTLTTGQAEARGPVEVL